MSDQPERLLKILAVTLAVGLAVVYVAAKVHFFTRFDPKDLRGYWAQHWPYTAGLVVIGAAIWAAARLSPAHSAMSGAKGQSNNE